MTNENNAASITDTENRLRKRQVVVDFFCFVLFSQKLCLNISLNVSGWMRLLRVTECGELRGILQDVSCKQWKNGKKCKMICLIYKRADKCN